MTVEVIRTIAGMRERFPETSAALVPTMGALHDGHLALVRRAAELSERVVVSIFVNPLQFAAGEDLERYPRDLDADLAALAPHPVEAVFAPDAEEMYPDGRPRITVSAGDLGRRLEGRSRLGHFDGMLTVVAKLLGIVRPSHVLFGEKDAQQLVLVRRMVHDLDIATLVDEVPTVRAEDGLALSSRNRYLDADQRRAATALHRAIEAAASAGDRGTDAALAAAEGVLKAEPLVALDYLAIVDPETFAGVDDDRRGVVRVVLAARVGTARLIDTGLLHLGR